MTDADDTAPEACPRCVESFKEHGMPREGVQPLRGGVRDSLAEDGRKQCQDCAFTGTLMRMAFRGMNWHAIRLTVANHRRESMRLPGARIGLSVYGARVSENGELRRHQMWLNEVVGPDPEME